ncbi:flagellar assembly protein FliX [Acetobacter conturbans]|uniref:Uncharacterized protein n=1 Tax=Acetobacter conturbans TaxID=1737472 RepID=A0ABX0JVV0_9PROT|nr:flagellar assembly protein FliX [Acetobacter conturbans]NHN87512.1 hypothetical protein [Acetobacter conturbans]
MSRIDSLGYVTRGRMPSKTRSPSAKSAFSLPREVEATESEIRPAAVSLTLLSLQESSLAGDEKEHRETLAWGQAALDVLKKLQIALLDGRSSPEALLVELDGICRDMPPSGMNGIAAVANSIRVKLAVEAARIRRQENKKNHISQQVGPTADQS